MANYIALAEVDGPWWSARSDINAAQIVHAFYTSKGVDSNLDDHLLKWNASPVEDLSHDDFMHRVTMGCPAK